MHERGHYGSPRYSSFGISAGADPSQPQPQAQPATWGKWLTYGLAGAAVVGVGLMVRSASKAMARTDAEFRSAGLKGPFEK